MNQDEIFKMAREAGWPGIYSKPLLSITMQEDDFLRFAALVAAAEREACARVCEEPGWNAANWCAKQIRARGD